MLSRLELCGRVTPPTRAYKLQTTLACPVCGAQLEDGEPLTCSACGREYAVVSGIPDLRLGPNVGEDHARARRLGKLLPTLDFEALLREYWHEGGRAPELVERFVAGDLAGEAKAEEVVSSLERNLGRKLGPGDRVVEIGCGTAAFALACARRGAEVTASDVSLPWLVLARKRLEEAGLDVPLVACAAEAPAFEPATFDIVAACDVIEHARDQEGFVRGCAHVLRPTGALFLTTPNRFSLGLEPHVRLWGVGYLPRSLARRYVSAVRKSPYDHVRLLSSRNLRRLLRGEGFRAEVVVPAVPEASERLNHGLELQLVRTYNRVRCARGARRALLGIGPFFHVFATRPQL